MRQGRTPGYFPDLKAGTGVGIPAPRQNVVSEVRADPGAGSFAAGLASLADGFTNYFAEQTQVELAKSQDKAKKQAVMDARQAYESGVTSVSSEITKEYKGTYADAYSSALGSLRASDAEKQFASFVVASDLQPHEIPEARNTYNKDNFGNGTGNLNFDAAFQKSWTANTEKLRHESTVAAAQKIKDTARKAVETSITNDAKNTGAPNFFELMNQVDKVRSVYRGYTEGEAISHVFGIYGFQATQSVTGALKYVAMLDQNLIPDTSMMAKQGTPSAVLPDGTTQITPRTSFAKRFPRQAAELRSKAFKAIESMKTITGQQKLASVSTYVNSLTTNINDIKDINDINDISAKFFAASSMVGTLEGTTGVTLTNVNKAKASLNKAKAEYATLISGYQTVEQVAIGSVGGRGDALEDYRGMEPKEKDKALRVFLGKGDLSDSRYFSKFTNALRNFNGLEQKPPQAFLDIIREQFSSGDRNAMAGVVAFAKTLDRDGSIGEAALGKDSENRILYEQARVVGIEAALSFQGDEEYMASLKASAEAKGDLGKVLYPDEKPQKAGEKLAEWYTSVGNDLDNQTTFLFSGKPLSQNLKDEISKVAPILKARLEAGGESVSLDAVKEAVVEYFQPRVLVGEETVMLGLPDSQRVYAGMGPTGSRQMPLEYNRGFDPKFQNAHIGTYAQPSDGSDPQDTYGNMIESVKNMPIPGVDGDALSVTIGTGARTGFGVIRSSKNFGAPIMFNAGQVLEKPFGDKRIANALVSYFFPQYAGNTAVSPDYTFTGDYSKDQRLVKEAFGSEYQLLPTGRGSYQLVILPFFKDIEPMEDRGEAPLGGQDLRRATLKSISGAQIPLVPPRGEQAGEGITP